MGRKTKAKPAPAPAIPVLLTLDEISILREAIDSHMYWQLADEDNRNNGYVIDDEASEELVEASLLQTKLEGIARRHAPPEAAKS